MWKTIIMKYHDNCSYSWQLLQCLGTNIDRWYAFVECFNANTDKIKIVNNCDILLYNNHS